MVEADAGAEGVGVEGRMGFRVMTRVTGELAPGLAVEQFTVDNKTNWNPLQPGRADVELTVRNTGNVGLVVDGNAHLGGHDAPLISGGDQQEVELLPGASHVFKTNLADVWPRGPHGRATVLRGHPALFAPTWALCGGVGPKVGKDNCRQQPWAKNLKG